MASILMLKTYARLISIGSCASFSLLEASCGFTHKSTDMMMNELGYQRDSVRIGEGYYDKHPNATPLNPEDSLVLAFFEVFDDSTAVYNNGRKIAQLYIKKANNPYTSTGYSYKNVVLHGLEKDSKIVIRLLTKKKYVEFIPDIRYPVYSIQRYNGIWYINPRYGISLK
ncbi:hypothetical protein [Chitinophaga vietnamensis]|uniref:hypothetical protein n=1 Tax=Chitinophaga vietnamensis TaxID=2593957 RepID=UPI001178B9FF|nr:hypothetical protein [Chitinophaga vietnamensis]